MNKFFIYLRNKLQEIELPDPPEEWGCPFFDDEASVSQPGPDSLHLYRAQVVPFIPSLLMGEDHGHPFIPEAKGGVPVNSFFR